MSGLTNKEAFEKLLDQETESARMMLEAPGRKVSIVAVCIGDEESEDGGYDVSLCRAISGGTTYKQGAAYTIALQREIDRINRLLK